mmetsp:Transcript_19664/g.16237  ORF Transcript_19664/g.16237 Transcript_19664/m.16237 type:complete len:155 (-) Transcript_19664:164-628(-)
MVDLPGFGFAKIATKVKARISDELGKYIADREALKLVVVLVDLRIEAQKTDMDALELLYSLDIPFLVVGTKADKLSNNELEVAVPKLEAAMGLEKGQLIACSSVSGEGKSFLWKQIMFGIFEDDSDDDDDVRNQVDDDDDDYDDDGGKVLVKFV